MYRSIRSLVMDAFNSSCWSSCRLSWTLSTLRIRSYVSPLRVRLIVTVLHLHLLRAGMRSLSSRTGNTSTYIPASSTFLILLLMLRVFPLYLHYDLRRCFVSY